MMLLAIDTSTKAIGLALFDGYKILREVSWVSQNHHTVELGPAVEAAIQGLTDAKTELSVVGVAIGPGSFTGIRIGLALAKGLAFSRQIPMIGIPTLDILAAAQPPSDILLACLLEAGRSRIAVGWYRAENNKWLLVKDYENLAPQEFIEKIDEPSLVCGEINENLKNQLLESDAEVEFASAVQSVRRPAVLAELAWRRYLNGDTADPQTLQPIYLHHGKPIPG